MKVFWFVAAAVALGVMIFYGRILFKRVSFAARMKKACRESGYGFSLTHAFWLLGWTRGKKCDFYIEKPEGIYAVKLIGAVSRTALFNYIDERHYAVRDLTFHTRAVSVGIPYKAKSKSRYDFPASLPEAWRGKEIIPAIVMVPVSCFVTCSRDGEMKPLSDGDKIAEGTFYTGSGFINEVLLKKG